MQSLNLEVFWWKRTKYPGRQFKMKQNIRYSSEYMLPQVHKSKFIFLKHRERPLIIMRQTVISKTNVWKLMSLPSFLNWQTSSEMGCFLTLFLETSQQILLNLFLNVANLTKLRIMSAWTVKFSQWAENKDLRILAGRGKTMVLLMYI